MSILLYRPARDAEIHNDLSKVVTSSIKPVFAQQFKVRKLLCFQVFRCSFLLLTCISCSWSFLLKLDEEKKTNERSVTGLSPCAPHATEPLCYALILYPPPEQWIVPDFSHPHAPALARQQPVGGRAAG